MYGRRTYGTKRARPACHLCSRFGASCYLHGVPAARAPLFRAASRGGLRAAGPRRAPTLGARRPYAARAAGFSSIGPYRSQVSLGARAPYRRPRRTFRRLARKPVPFRRSSAPAARMAGRKMLRARRTGASAGNSLRSVSTFGMIPKNVGGKVVRVYEFDPITQSNTAAVTTGYGLGLRLSHSVGAFALGLYLGRPISGTGTLVEESVDFAVDAPHFFDTFKWFRINKIEVTFIPIVSVITDLATNPNDIVANADPGTVAIAHWNGDTELVAPTTGLLLTATFTDFRRDNAHINFQPIGTKSVTYATRLNAVEDINAQYGYDRLTFPVAPPLQTESVRQTATEYPFYGYQYWWDHPNLAADAAKFKFTMRVRVECQWNTVQDSSLTAAEQKAQDQARAVEREAAVLGKPASLQPANPTVPRIVYPATAAKPDKEEKKYSAEDPDGVLEYTDDEMVDVTDSMARAAVAGAASPTRPSAAVAAAYANTVAAAVAAAPISIPPLNRQQSSAPPTGLTSLSSLLPKRR